VTAAGGAGERTRPLDRTFFARDPLLVAPDLLGKVLDCDGRAGRIVEVEAYRGADDAASHAYRGRTARNATMFGPAGHLYVYFTYGMHFCANVVCNEPGVAGAVLLRALEPLRGLDAMIERRAASRGAAPPSAAALGRWLCAGPARLCQALGVDRSLDGADLVTGDQGVRLLDEGSPPVKVASGPRVGLSARVGDAYDLPWRFWVGGSASVSAPTGGSAAYSGKNA
jgi:DNA-3-methyladenine glycosylase